MLHPGGAREAQRSCLEFLRGSCAYFVAGFSEFLSVPSWERELVSKSIDYGGNEITKALPLKLGELLPGLPRAGIAGSVAAIDLVGPEVKAWLEDPTVLL